MAGEKAEAVYESMSAAVLCGPNAFTKVSKANLLRAAASLGRPSRITIGEDDASTLAEAAAAAAADDAAAEVAAAGSGEVKGDVAQLEGEVTVVMAAASKPVVWPWGMLTLLMELRSGEVRDRLLHCSSRQPGRENLPARHSWRCLGCLDTAAMGT